MFRILTDPAGGARVGDVCIRTVPGHQRHHRRHDLRRSERCCPGDLTVVNTGTGDSRVVVANGSGLFRALLLALGTYREVRRSELRRARLNRPASSHGRPDRGHQHQDDGPRCRRR